MNRKLIILFVLLVTISLSSCTSGFYRDPFSVDISINTTKKHDINDLIEFEVKYGHDYPENSNFDVNGISEHKIIVSVYEETSPYEHPTIFLTLFEKSYTGDELGDESYRYTPSSGIFSRDKYKQVLTLEVDLSEVDFDRGRIRIKFIEIDTDINSIEYYVFEEVFFVVEDDLVIFDYKYISD